MDDVPIPERLHNMWRCTSVMKNFLVWFLHLLLVNSVMYIYRVSC